MTEIDLLRTIVSELFSKLEQRQPKPPCSQALKQSKVEKSTFSTHLCASYKSETSMCSQNLYPTCPQISEKVVFPAFCLLGGLWTRHLWLPWLKFWAHVWFKFSQHINFCDLEDAQRCVEKVLFPAFACLSACEQGAFGCLCSSFEHISDLNFLNISISAIWKMHRDVLKRCFFRLFLAWTPVSKEPLAVFVQVLSTSLI